MAAAPKLRIDVTMHNLLMHASKPPAPAKSVGLTLPGPAYPQYPERIKNPGLDHDGEGRRWTGKDIYRDARGWLFPNVRSREMPGMFHPTTAYLLVMKFPRWRAELRRLRRRATVVPAYRRRQFCSILTLALLAGTLLPAPAVSQEASAPEAQLREATLQPARADASAERIFAELISHNEARNAALRSYSALRSYAVSDPKGKVHAQEQVQVNYRAPDTKSFTTISGKGSPLVRQLVLHGLMNSEAETTSGKKHRDSTINNANYTFSLLGEQDLGANHCFVVQATPTRSDKYLFEGRVWIDTQDYAIVQIAGHPAKKLSVWIDKADFVRRYQKVGDFWLPLKDETNVHVRFYGNEILTIDHQSYRINEVESAQLSVRGENAD